MAEPNSRLEQFKKMAEADPDNALGHFSLGREYLRAQQYGPAADSLRRAIAIDPALSKAYEMLGEVLLGAGQREEAIEVWQRGVEAADQRGDLMPRNAMASRLTELGAPVPEAARPQRPTEVGEGQVLCVRCGQIKPRMAEPPFRHRTGQEIQEKVCPDCWREWIGMGTKVINELRLPLADPEAQRIFDQHMREFLNLGPAPK